MGEDAVVQSIRDFVSHFADIPDVQYCAVPYDLDSHEGIGYLLMVASVNQGTAAEYVRDFIRALYDRLGGDLLRFHDLPPSNYQDIIAQ